MIQQYYQNRAFRNLRGAVPQGRERCSAALEVLSWLIIGMRSPVHAIPAKTVSHVATHDSAILSKPRLSKPAWCGTTGARALQCRAGGIELAHHRDAKPRSRDPRQNRITCSDT